MFVIASGEKRCHFVGRPVAKVRPGVQGRVGRVSGAVHPATNSSKTRQAMGLDRAGGGLREWEQRSAGEE
uniref:Uncharacterized protein MANES_12G132200 n=1 Tax=Rhizophora mucronata TaxID=61149 RepID=A0A2P2K0P2_RHIMU